MDKNIYEKLKNIVGEDNVYVDEPMSKHCTMRVGGIAMGFVTPSSTEELLEVFKLLNVTKTKYTVCGNGSNFIVPDSGYSGVVISLGNAFSIISITDNKVTAQAGALLSKVGNIVCKEGLAGFEFATGIPGSVGGAVYMNAGAYGGEIKDIIESATVYDGENVRVLTKDELELGYRSSIISKNGYIVLEATFALEKGEQSKIEDYIKELSKRRRDKQPLEYPSCGSTFKRPKGYFAGQLIEEAGLRGFKYGGMMVSEKHCGFVINTGNGTATDFIEITNKIKEIVYEKTGVLLELEVKVLCE